MGGCCSDVSEAPKEILPDPVPEEGYDITLKALRSMVGDTYEIFTSHYSPGQEKKWLNIRCYKQDDDKVRYILENYHREEGKDEGQLLAYAIANPFDVHDYEWKKVEEVSESDGDWSSSPDDPGEYVIHKAKWKLHSTVPVFNDKDEQLGEIKLKAKGKTLREAMIKERPPKEGQECGEKYWDVQYETRIKKMKYTISIPDHEDVVFKLKGSIRKQQPLEWFCDAFVTRSSDNSESKCTANAGHDCRVSFVMAFICTQVLCPNDVHQGCRPASWCPDWVFPPLDHLDNCD